MKRYKHLAMVVDLKTQYLQKEIKLRAKMSSIAINKAEKSILERQEASNGKYDLLKEQSAKFEATYSTKSEVRAISEAVASLSKIVYIGLGILAALQFLIPLFK
jgi:hypothetical protein